MLAPVGSASSCGRAQVLGGGRVSSVVIDAQVFDRHHHVMERALSPTGLFRPAGFGKCAADYVWNVFCDALGQRKPSSSCKSRAQSSSMAGDEERFLLQGTGMASARLEPKKVDVGLGIRSEAGNFGAGGGRHTPLGPRVWAQQQQRKIAKLKKLRMDLEPPSTPSIVVEGEKIAMESRLWASAESQLEAESVNVSNQSSLPGIIFPPLSTVGKSTNIVWHECMVKREEREAMLGQRGCVIWMTGLSGSGKSTLACTLDHALLQRGKLCYVLDGDNMRHGLNKNLGFSAEDRSENIRRVGEVAKLFADAGIICIASFISPYKKDREACRELVSPGDFIEVFMNFPLTVCEQRDPKGLYKLARAGKIKCFTGIDDPYEEPVHSEIVMEPVDGVCPTPEVMAAKIISYLEGRGILQSRSV